MRSEFIIIKEFNCTVNQTQGYYKKFLTFQFHVCRVQVKLGRLTRFQILNESRIREIRDKDNVLLKIMFN